MARLPKMALQHRCIMNGDESDPFITSHSFKISKDLITWTDTNHTGKSNMVITLRRIGNRLTRTNLTILQRTKPY